MEYSKLNNKEITFEKIKDIYKTVTEDEINYISDTVSRLISKYTIMAQDNLTQKNADECLKIVKEVAMKGENSVTFTLCHIDEYDYYFKEFNNEYWSWTNILTRNKKEYTDAKVTQAFNSINKKYGIPAIKIKMYSWDKNNFDPCVINYEPFDSKNEVTKKSPVLCLGCYVEMDKKIVSLAEKYFSGFKIELKHYRYSGQVFHIFCLLN